MGQDVKVSRRLTILGDAEHYANVIGPLQEEMVHFHDHFTDDTLCTDKWEATSAGASAAIAVEHATYPGGMCRITTGTADATVEQLSTPLCWEDDMNAICEARILIADVSGVALFFGFSDLTAETSPAMPIDYDGGVLATPTGRDAVGFICDADDSVNGVSSIVCVGAVAGSLETAIDTDTDWADNKWHVLRVELNPDGDATFFLDKTRVGFMETAITSGTHMCITVAVANRDAAQDYVYIDRVDGWQDEVQNA